MRDTVIFSVSHPYTWVRPMARSSMARWLDCGINGSIDVARWLDANGGCLQPRCLDARLNANLDAKLDAGSMQARCRLDASRPGLSDERTASEVTYSEAETVPLMFPSNGPSAGLKGGCLAAVLSDFKWSVCRMDASAHELSEKYRFDRAASSWGAVTSIPKFW